MVVLINPEPEACAKAANLIYTSDKEPGISRKPAGEHFKYFDQQGCLLKDKITLQRIQQLAIPPAYTQVWICPQENGHLQATGRDARGRKQYRYHAKWQKIRNTTKYHRMLAFGKALPDIRLRVAADLELTGLPKNKVLATIVRLLESTLIRVGNAEYAEDNQSYGLTTLRKKHVAVSGNEIVFDFKGKSKQDWSLNLFDKKIARIIKRCEELPGQQLFKYLDENNQKCTINSQDVNQYLQEISGLDITAKDFRTWAGTVLASIVLMEFSLFDSATQAKKNVAQAIAKVAKKLGNTPAICRQCYIHPAIINTYIAGDLMHHFKPGRSNAQSSSMQLISLEEKAVLKFLQKSFRTQKTAKIPAL